MKITTNAKGQLAATKAELRALELGYIPSRPIFDTRYDLIIDDHSKLIRAQIKYADGKSSHSQGSVSVKLDYEDRQRNFFTYKETEVDVLIVYIPKIDRLCFFPLEVFVGKRRLSVRLENSRNSQKKGIILASEYFW